jgi:hypothetical protein
MRGACAAAHEAVRGRWERSLGAMSGGYASSGEYRAEGGAPTPLYQP